MCGEEPPGRLELGPRGLKGRRPNQLSYGGPASLERSGAVVRPSDRRLPAVAVRAPHLAVLDFQFDRAHGIAVSDQVRHIGPLRAYVIEVEDDRIARTAVDAP